MAQAWNCDDCQQTAAVMVQTFDNPVPMAFCIEHAVTNFEAMADSLRALLAGPDTAEGDKGDPGDPDDVNPAELADELVEGGEPNGDLREFAGGSGNRGSGDSAQAPSGDAGAGADTGAEHRDAEHADA